MFDFNRGCYVLIVGYTIYKKQSEKTIDTGLDDVAEEILAKVKSAGQLKKWGKNIWGCGFVNIVFCRYPVYNGSRRQEQEETW